VGGGCEWRGVNSGVTCNYTLHSTLHYYYGTLRYCHTTNTLRPLYDHTTTTLLLYYHYAATTPPLHCYYTTTLLLHYYHTTTILLPYYYYTTTIRSCEQLQRRDAHLVPLRGVGASRHQHAHNLGVAFAAAREAAATHEVQRRYLVVENARIVMSKAGQSGLAGAARGLQRAKAAPRGGHRGAPSL
jgi:hypothetical protein